MKQIFSLDGPMWTFLGKLVDMIWLSLLWLVISLPVVTLGGATSALHYVGLKLARNEEGYVTRQFFQAFRENFVKGLLLELILGAVGGLLAFNIWFYFNLDASWALGLGAVIVCCCILFLMTFLYTFAVQAQFENTVTGVLRFALALAVHKIGTTIFMILFDVTLLVGGFFLFPPVLIFVPGLMMGINCIFINHAFTPYLNEL